MDKFRDRKQMSGFQGLGGRRNREWLLTGHRDFFWGGEKVVEVDRGDGCAL